MLNMQNIDDRYIFEWNNIRFIGKKEQDIHDFVLLKDSMNTDKNVMSLNFNGDGVSLIGSTYKTGKENQDKSVNQFEINKNTIVEWKKRIEIKKTRVRKPSKINDDALREDVEKYPDAYQYERAARFNCGVSSIGAALKRLNITVKKRR